MSSARERYEDADAALDELHDWRGRTEERYAQANSIKVRAALLLEPTECRDRVRNILNIALGRVMPRHSDQILAEVLAEAEVIVQERRAAAIKEAQDFLAATLTPKLEREGA